MFSRIHWSLLVLIGGIINVCVNYGYKVIASHGGGVAWTGVGALVFTSIALAVFARLTEGKDLSAITKGKMPFMILLMGVATALVFVCFISALTKGPISLVDPLWACIYALMSVSIGMMIIRERPKKLALLGIGLYLIGAILMGVGQS